MYDWSKIAYQSSTVICTVFWVSKPRIIFLVTVQNGNKPISWLKNLTTWSARLFLVRLIQVSNIKNPFYRHRLSNILNRNHSVLLMWRKHKYLKTVKISVNIISRIHSKFLPLISSVVLETTFVCFSIRATSSVDNSSKRPFNHFEVPLSSRLRCSSTTDTLICISSSMWVIRYDLSWSLVSATNHGPNLNFEGRVSFLIWPSWTNTPSRDKFIMPVDDLKSFL